MSETILEDAAADDPFAVGATAPRVIHGGGLRVAATVVGVLGGLISAPLVVRHLGNDAFGRYQTVVSVIFIATALSEGGLAYVAVRAYTTADRDRRLELVANLMGMRLVLELIVLACVAAFGLAAGYEPVMVVGLTLGGIALVVSAQQGALTVILQGQLRLAQLAATEIVNQLATTVLLVVLVIAGASLLWFFVVSPVVWVLTLGVTAFVVRRDAPRRPRFDRPIWRYLAGETALFAFASALGASYYQLTQVAMSLLSTPKQTGNYAVAFRIVAVASTVPWVLGGSLLAVLSAVAGDRERLRYIANRAFEGSAIIGGWFVLVIVIGASFGIAVVGGDHASVSVLRIMGAGAGATFLVASSSFVLLAARRSRALFVANLAVFLLALLLAGTLIPAYGARGGAIASASLEFALALIYGVLLARGGIAPPLHFVWRFALALAVAFGVGLALLALHPVVGVIGATVVYLAVLWRVRAIPSELLEAIPRWGRR